MMKDLEGRMLKVERGRLEVGYEVMMHSVNLKNISFGENFQFFTMKF